MVELNSTIFPLLGPIGTVVNTVKVLIGGAFGVYLIIIYLRWKEYVLMKRMLGEIRSDIRELASKQGVKMEPVKQKKTAGQFIKEKLRQKPMLVKR